MRVSGCFLCNLRGECGLSTLSWSAGVGVRVEQQVGRAAIDLEAGDSTHLGEQLPQVSGPPVDQPGLAINAKALGAMDLDRDENFDTAGGTGAEDSGPDGRESSRLKSRRHLPITGDIQRRGGPGTGPRESIQEENEMSSLIQQTQAPAIAAAAATRRTGAAAAAGRLQETAAGQSAGPISVETMPSTPPAEVLAQMRQAADTWDSLQAEGYEVHYSQDPQTRRTTVELRDAQGVTVRRLTPSEALELAAGEGPPES